jgi:hypothetical protein
MKWWALLVVLCACDAGSVYAYTANLYDPQNDCVDHAAGVDIMEGSSPGASCGAKCLAGKNLDDGGVQVWVTTMCGPPPHNADVSGTNALCAPAFDALNRGDFCADASAE